MVYVSSDFHFFHNNIHKYTNRHSNCNDEYICGLIYHLKNIKESDILIFLGDLACSTRKSVQKCKYLMDFINCKKIFIRGNHDYWLTNDDIKWIGFEIVEDYLLFGDTLFCHYPFDSDKPYANYGKHNYLWDLFCNNPKIKTIYCGHTHNTNPHKDDNTLRINCCVDFHKQGYNIVPITDKALSKQIEDYYAKNADYIEAPTINAC